LEQLGIENVVVAVGDGGLGWPPGAPFDAIIVSAACACPPAALLEQLAPGGRLVLPIGDTMRQTLTRIRKQNDQTFTTAKLSDCAFVPLLGAYCCR
jgi:protein-L-isoaspartate(D-aspartate) O-methyltransferase